jgi:hypothetical protein
MARALLLIMIVISLLVPLHGFHASLNSKALLRQSRTAQRCSSVKMDCGEEHILLPVQRGNGRTVSFHCSDVAALHEVRSELAARQNGEELPCLLIFPSWRHHVVQYDALSAALTYLGVPPIVAPLPDGLWAYVLKRLGITELRKAAKQRMMQLAVIYALEPMFTRIESIIRDAHERTGRSVIVLASDDSTWLLQAFLNHRELANCDTYPVRAAVLLGSHQQSYAGSVALDAFPAVAAAAAAAVADDTPAAAAAAATTETYESTEDAVAAAVVPYYRLNVGTAAASYSSSSSSIDDDASSGAQITCIGSEEEVEECVIGSFGESNGRQGLPWLSDAAMLRVWLPKVLGQR